MNQDLKQIISTVEDSLHFVRWLTPTNLIEEREKFLLNPRYNPHIIYPEFEKELLVRNLDVLHTTNGIQDGSLGNWILQRKREYLLLENEFLLNLETDKYTDLSCNLYQCTFNSSCIESANNDSQIQLPFVSTENKTPEQIIDGINQYLVTYHVYDWDVQLSENTDFYFRVDVKSRKILIGKRFNWDFCDFDNMLAHEIDGHVLRAINASRQMDSTLKHQFPFYIKTEEGLASFLGDYCSTTAEISRKHHALKYLAGDLARSHSFKDVFDFLISNGFTADLAFQRTFRLKRGISDTSRPGCFAKEAMYYEGMMDVKQYIDAGKSVYALFSGKFGLEDLSFIDIPTNVLVPERIKEYIEKIH